MRDLLLLIFQSVAGNVGLFLFVFLVAITIRHFVMRDNDRKEFKKKFDIPYNRAGAAEIAEIVEAKLESAMAEAVASVSRMIGGVKFPEDLNNPFAGQSLLIDWQEREREVWHSTGELRRLVWLAKKFGFGEIAKDFEA